jgi:hypothetical protein
MIQYLLVDIRRQGSKESGASAHCVSWQNDTGGWIFEGLLGFCPATVTAGGDGLLITHA